MNERRYIWKAAAIVTALGIGACCARAQSASQTVEPESIQQAQTVHIPATAFDRDTLLPIKDLTASDFSLDVDGKPQAFQLSRPWSGTINAKTGQPEDRPNLLIILPLAVPANRAEVLHQAIQDLSQGRELGWNISILDDTGMQTPYTRDLKTVIAELKSIGSEDSAEIDLAGWRSTAAVAISDMRHLPGRRVVLALGNIFHEVVIRDGQLLYENFQIGDVASAADRAGAVIYAANSAEEIGQFRRLAPYYSVAGEGPWLLRTQNGHRVGWIANSVAQAIHQVRERSLGAYDIDLYLDLKQMDGQPHRISTTVHRSGMTLNVPPFYIAPNLAQLRAISNTFPSLQRALKNPPPDGFSPLQLTTQLTYFPHPDGKTGTQIASTGFFWNGTTEPPAKLEAVLRLEQTTSGYMMNTTVGSLPWSLPHPIWNTALNLPPGAYALRVTAADASGKIAATTNTPFTIEPPVEDAVLVSSLLLSKACVFSPPPSSPEPKSVDYLRAGDCNLLLDPNQSYSPQDVVWTLVRVTPVGKLAARPAKDWKGSFLLIDATGSKRAEQKIQWLTAEDGSFVGTTAFPLGNPKLKLADGDYAVVFKLKGPGVEHDYIEEAPFRVYGVVSPPAQ